MNYNTFSNFCLKFFYIIIFFSSVYIYNIYIYIYIYIIFWTKIDQLWLMIILWKNCSNSVFFLIKGENSNFIFAANGIPLKFYKVRIFHQIFEYDKHIIIYFENYSRDALNLKSGHSTDLKMKILSFWLKKNVILQ